MPRNRPPRDVRNNTRLEQRVEELEKTVRALVAESHERQADEA